MLVGSVVGAAGSVAGFGWMASFFNQPMIGGLYFNLDSILTKGALDTLAGGGVAGVLGGAVMGAISDILDLGIPIYADKYEEKGGNAISEQTLVTSLNSDTVTGGEIGALTKITDNVVPNPRQYVIHGYIGLPAELSGAFSGLGPFMNLIDKIGRPLLHTIFQRVIQKNAEARQPLKFTTSEGETIPALVKDYSFSKTAENQNFIECDITLQEFRYLALSDDEQSTSKTGVFSGVAGAASTIGRTVANALF